MRRRKEKKNKKPDRPKKGFKNKTEEKKLSKSKDMKLSKEPVYKRPKRRKRKLKMK
jgi:hypothetical protein